MNNNISKVVIAGGGTAGWMTAIFLKTLLSDSIEVKLIESEAIGTVGVGEASIPPLKLFNKFIRLDESEFISRTNATFKLAIQFEDWRTQGESYFHTFGAPGTYLGLCGFQNFWLRAKAEGINTSLWDYDLNYLCCAENKFGHIDTTDPVHELPYAYHFDSALYGKLLREKSEKKGVQRIEGIIDSTILNDTTRLLESITLKSGQQINGDFFIDCTGGNRTLIGGAMEASFVSWADLLPANRAIAVQTERLKVTLPYTRSIAHDFGWQWSIPLRHRNGNGIVYSTQYADDDLALKTLEINIAGEALNDYRYLKFETGKVEHVWKNNVVAIGLSAGFLEPLESTSIYLIQSALIRLGKLFPKCTIDHTLIKNFNQETTDEMETIRDFIVLHYTLNERYGSRFWDDMRELKLPSTLQERMALFKSSARIFDRPGDIFTDSSWLQVMVGQGVTPVRYHPEADIPSKEGLTHVLQKVRSKKESPLKSLLGHDHYLARFV